MTSGQLTMIRRNRKDRELHKKSSFEYYHKHKDEQKKKTSDRKELIKKSLKKYFKNCDKNPLCETIMNFINDIDNIKKERNKPLREL